MANKKKKPKVKISVKVRNIGKALRAARYGVGIKYARVICDEAARTGVPYAIAFANVEQESAFHNIFGHDPGGIYQGQKVTEQKVKDLINHVKRGGVSNGVGLTQLTYIGFVEEADALKGGAAKVHNQCYVGFKLLHDLYKQHGGWHEAFRAYNGTGPQAEEYARMMDARREKWASRLTLRKGWLKQARKKAR